MPPSTRLPRMRRCRRRWSRTAVRDVELSEPLRASRPWGRVGCGARAPAGKAHRVPLVKWSSTWRTAPLTRTRCVGRSWRSWAPGSGARHAGRCLALEQGADTLLQPVAAPRAHGPRVRGSCRRRRWSSRRSGRGPSSRPAWKPCSRRRSSRARSVVDNGASLTVACARTRGAAVRRRAGAVRAPAATRSVERPQRGAVERRGGRRLHRRRRRGRQGLAWL
jgi:hypothetical protein